jgi:hypothetical protein
MLVSFQEEPHQCMSLICLSASFSTVFKRNDGRLIGRYAILSTLSAFTGFGINYTLTYLQVPRINLYGKQAVSVLIMCGTKFSATCCRSACTFSFGVDYLNCLIIDSDYLISDWLFICLARSIPTYSLCFRILPDSAHPAHNLFQIHPCTLHVLTAR